MTLLRRMLSALVHGPAANEHFHFHRGPQGLAVVCHDPDCGMPRLEH
jgi:hypothetical protein